MCIRDRTMEDHGQMGFDVVDQIVEVVCGVSVGDDAVHRLPQNQSARALSLIHISEPTRPY